MSVNNFKNEIENLKSHKEKVFEQIIKDIKYISGEEFKASDVIDVDISESGAYVCIKYITKNDEEDGYIPVWLSNIPIAYFNNRDKFMKDLKDRKARTKRQNLEMMISMAKDQLEQYKKELNKLNDGK